MWVTPWSWQGWPRERTWKLLATHTHTSPLHFLRRPFPGCSLLQRTRNLVHTEFPSSTSRSSELIQPEEGSRGSLMRSQPTPAEGTAWTGHWGPQWGGGGLGDQAADLHAGSEPSPGRQGPTELTWRTASWCRRRLSAGRPTAGGGRRETEHRGR